MELLNLWGAATLTGGRSSGKANSIRQLQEAGFQDIQATRLVAGEELHAFKALWEKNS